MVKTKEETEVEFTRGIDAIGLAHRQNVVDQLNRQARHNESLRQAVNGETIGGIDSGGPEVGSKLRIDSPTTVNHYHGDTNKRKTAGTLAKLAIGAGLIATGAGSFAGLSLIADVLKGQVEKTEPTKPTIKPAAPDGTRYSLDLGD